MLEVIKSKLSKIFAVNGSGDLKSYVGINIGYDFKKGVIKLDQKHYIESLAKRFVVENSKLYSTPMEQNLKLETSQSASNEIKYRNLIGALLYVAIGTGIDISYSENYLRRFQNCYDEPHLKYALRIMDCSVAADWGGYRSDRKPTTAAENEPLSEAVSELKYLKKLQIGFDVEIEKPIKTNEDDSGATAISKYGNLTKSSKYNGVYNHFLHKCYEHQKILIVRIDSESTVADILTKTLGCNKFENLRRVARLT
ncbi:PREDICTED: uncharacterized protein LOC108554674 [Eufriesea mexicana]|uniref:uncharacterized protein LOC108554674 n=1 Tax=Eufriesea mexicana TaxID=516756 RepID=UPI00083BEEC0|nr:PREDICTED: uncharacterized protein LOC108554674 [Eufriesea mexicana]